jgi:hypothetical protein
MVKQCGRAMGLDGHAESTCSHLLQKKSSRLCDIYWPLAWPPVMRGLSRSRKLCAIGAHAHTSLASVWPRLKLNGAAHDSNQDCGND